MSETPSSINTQNMIERKSLDYLLHEISLLLNIPQNYKIKLDMIWENHYKNGDFLEAHAHAGSHFSFIIYKKIESKKMFKKGLENPQWTHVEHRKEAKTIQDTFKSL